jgi:hypothetical protein
MFSDIGDVSSIQRDSGQPTIVTAGAAPGESGVAVMQLRYAIRAEGTSTRICASTLSALPLPDRARAA